MKIYKDFLVVLFVLLIPFSAFAVDITDKLSLSGTATAVYQWLHMTKGYLDNDKTKDRGSGVIDFNVSFKPTENDEFFLRTSFAKGSGLKDINPFKFSPNADDLFHDLHNINGRSRDHLQELWYSHRFEIQKNISLILKAGIIDPTAFIDDNAYADNEIAQFMNEVFVNNTVANLPSYDGGVAVEFQWNNFHLRLVGMQSKNENRRMDIRKYNWVGAQVGYKLDTSLGEGNYRIYAYTTNKRFENWDANAYEPLKGFGLSLDQQLIKDTLGAFFRAGWQDDSAKIDYNRMFSIGLNINGSLWKRKDDELGIGYAYLKSPSKAELKHSQVFEAYIKFKLFSYKSLSSDITFDYQYIHDKAHDSENTLAGNIYGVRLNFNF